MLTRRIISSFYLLAHVYGVDVVDEFIEESMKIKFRCGEVYANVTIVKWDIQKPLSFGAAFDLVTMFAFWSISRLP